MKAQRCHYLENNQLIRNANQLTGFIMIATLAFSGAKPTPFVMW